MKCLECGKPLVAIGYARENGKCHSDWATRKYHKQCFKELVPCVIYFDVPYEDRERAKALGAWFDFEVKAWYAPNTTVEYLLAKNNYERKFI